MQGVAARNPANPQDWQTKDAGMDTPTPAADANEAADKQEEFDERQAVTENLEVRLRDINDALGKIASGTYGVCEVSGEPIEEDRLAANPAARTCKAHM